MVNFNKLKKYGALSMVGLMPLLFFVIFIYMNSGIIYALVATVVSLFLSMFVFSKMTKNPFTSMIEGDGVITLSIDSTGVIEPFLCSVNSPKVTGNLHGQEVSTLFDRKETMFNLKPPVKGEFQYKGIGKDGFGQEYNVYELKIPKGKEGSINYAFQQYPCFIYNKTLKTFVTKDSLAKGEMEGMVKHTVFYIKSVVEDLNTNIRNFARYVVELSKPKSTLGGLFGNWIFWVILIAVVGLILYIAWPMLSQAMQGGISGVTGGGPVGVR